MTLGFYLGMDKGFNSYNHQEYLNLFYQVMYQLRLRSLEQRLQVGIQA